MQPFISKYYRQKERESYIYTNSDQFFFHGFHCHSKKVPSLNPSFTRDGGIINGVNKCVDLLRFDKITNSVELS